MEVELNSLSESCYLKNNPSYFTVPGSKQSDDRRFGNSRNEGNSSQLPLGRQITPPINKINFRLFGRSISTNSTESSLFIKGEPRLSDIAPELAAKHISRQNARIKFQNGITYSSSIIDSDISEPSDEVFLEETKVRYRHFPSSGRRHSIGDFATRERSESLSSSSKSFREDLLASTLTDVDNTYSSNEALASTSPSLEIVDDNSTGRVSSPLKKKWNKSVRKTPITQANMDDIWIVSLKCSSAASLWVDYFTCYFQQIGKQTSHKAFKIHHLAAEDFIQANSETNLYLERSSFVKLQIVVLCPGFLELLSKQPSNSNFGKLFLPDRTMALLLGVSDDDLNETHKKALPTYFKWHRMSVGQDQDENFTKEFIGNAMAILAKVWKQRSSVSAHDKTSFSVSPKKIRQGQNSVFILLGQPLQKEDTIRVYVEKHNDIIEVKNVKRRNQYTLKVSVPDNCTEVTAIINILVEKNGSIIGTRPIKCESRLRELEQILRLSNNPVEFMCQTLGFTPADKENLDNWLVHNFQRNLPTHFNLLSSHSAPFTTAAQTHRHCYEEYPSLLHFAAKFGLEKLTLQLLDCPGADVACEIKNLYDLTPAEIAEQNNHDELAASLRNYMNISEFSSMYAKLKAMSTYHSEDHDNSEEPEYLVPRNHEDFYKICPPPRPVTLKVAPPSPSPSIGVPIDFVNSTGYTPMHNLSCNKVNLSGEDTHFSSPVDSLAACSSFKSKKHHLDIDSPSTSSSSSSSKNFDSCEDKVQKELLEIINDFKNNVHSISQVEKLVEEWKNRNDVQKSFKEKQEQLKEMRLRYEKIQHDMKLALKKPSPFDRIKKLFVKNKTQHSDKTYVVSQPAMVTASSNLNIPTMHAQRPVSSLSTSSSGSSGRMSTISGCSLGDSGTHSDNEDRKNAVRVFTDDDFRNELSRAIGNLHYPPLSILKLTKNNTSHKLKLSTTFEETTSNLAKSEGAAGLNDQYYIQFPPSGLPVTDVPHHITKKPEEGMKKNLYMNVKANAD